MTNDFGLHLTLDLSGCDNGKLASLDLICQLLDKLPDTLKMTKVIPPYVFQYCGAVPEDRGITGFHHHAEVHFHSHSTRRRGSRVDIFSCKSFDPVLAEAVVTDAGTGRSCMLTS